MNWFEKLESQLNEQLESFLSANPEQKKLLEQEELEVRRESLIKRSSTLQKQIKQIKLELLDLVPQIKYWQNNLKKAQESKTWKLIEEASINQKQLMNRGNNQWQALRELDFEIIQLNNTLLMLQQAMKVVSKESLNQNSTYDNSSKNSWDQFETQEELEYLRRRKKT